MKTVTLIPGDGTGPEITEATRRIIEASGAKIEWEPVEAGAGVMEKYGTPLPEHVLESIAKNKVALKGPITTPVGSGFRSVNVAIRKHFDLYANFRPCLYMEGVKTPIPNVDLVVVRENTEDLYAGVEHMVGKNAAESIKIITREGTERIARAAFEYAVENNRKKITVVHKANIMKCTDGLFLEVSQQIGKEYPQIECDERIVDNMCMQLVQKPHLYDILLCPNLYGDVISDLCAGLIGGLGVAPGANIGKDTAMFEAIHGSAPKYTGMNKVNPTALILSGALMLEYLKELEAADRIKSAVKQVIAAKEKVTYDLGGTAGTSEMADEIIRVMTS